MDFSSIKHRLGLLLNVAQLPLEIRVRHLQKKYPGIQLMPSEIVAIARAIQNHDECKFLVFGLGNDSPAWSELNRNGKTVFLEDNAEWHSRISNQYRHLETYLIDCKTNIDQWQSLLSSPDELQIELPKQLLNEEWDVILVDGPCGSKDWHLSEFGTLPTGRMASIFMSSELCKTGGDVFVHDCEREVEDAYTRKHLANNKTLVEEVNGRALLRHYQ